LENSGLQKDLQYFTQQSSRNDEGKTIRPDVVISYPDGRKIIIDSKVSLTHYYNVCNAQTEDEEKACLKQLIQSIKAHIEGLASKNYGDISQALDFIIMFVPVETAYIAAMHGDPSLWQYAYKKSILLISPANLIATLTLVKDMWRKDAVDKNAHEIADKAGKLYDKLVGFVETFEKVGIQLDKAGETWTEARKQLTAGKGNLISQALRMNALKINSRKELPDDLGNEAILNDHFGIEKTSTDSIKLYE
jgi:DNA recombination protein RmuC